MACWNLESDGKCKITGGSCDTNEYACPIAKHERRVAFAENYHSEPGGCQTVIGIVILIAVIAGIFSCICGSC